MNLRLKKSVILRTPVLKFTLFLTFLLSTSIKAEDRDLAGCSVEMKSFFFNFASLMRKNSSEGDYQVKFNKGKGDNTINFNICNQAFRTCNDAVPDFANMINQNNTCNHLSSGSISNIKVSLINDNKPEKGVSLYFEGGNYCNETTKFQLTLDIVCDPDATKTTFDLDTYSLADKCRPKIVMNSKAGCPVFSLHSLWQFFIYYSFVIGIFMILLGIFLLVFGGRYFKVTMFLGGLLITTATIMLTLFITVFPTNTPFWAVWLTLGVAAGIGCGVGYAAFRWSRVGVLLIGSWIGALLGSLLYNIFIYIFAKSNPLLALWLTVAFSAILVAVLSMVFFDHAVILGSCICGAYMLVRGVSIYTGGFPNEILIY